MRLAYFDCFAGISGDMTLGALLDAGLPLADLQRVLDGLRVSGWRLNVTRVTKRGIAGTQVKVEVDDTVRICRTVTWPIFWICWQPVIWRKWCASAQPRSFQRLAVAEAAVHGSDIAHVHFHEVGAIDSIVDIVGAVAGLHLLGIERIVASPLPLGHGFVSAAHGLLPVPAPAVLRLLAERNFPVRDRDVAGELVTPTGAALLAELADSVGPFPPMTLQATGFGAGQRDMPYPNLLRLVLGEAAAAPEAAAGLAAAYQVERLQLLETNIDDMNPEILGYVCQRLFDAGALDVWLTPILMKKGRPATLLSVLCQLERADRLIELILLETTSLGVRRQEVERLCVPRAIEQVETPWGPVRVKVAHLPELVSARPRRSTRIAGRSAQAAWRTLARGLPGGAAWLRAASYAAQQIRENACRHQDHGQQDQDNHHPPTDGIGQAAIDEAAHQTPVVDQAQHDDQNERQQHAVERLAGKHGLDERFDRQQNDRRAHANQRGVDCEEYRRFAKLRLTPASQPKASQTTYAVESGSTAAEKTEALSKPRANSAAAYVPGQWPERHSGILSGFNGQSMRKEGGRAGDGDKRRHYHGEERTDDHVEAFVGHVVTFSPLSTIEDC